MDQPFFPRVGPADPEKSVGNSYFSNFLSGKRLSSTFFEASTVEPDLNRPLIGLSACTNAG